MRPRAAPCGGQIESELGCLEFGLRKQWETIPAASSTRVLLQESVPACDFDPVEKGC